MNGEQIQRLARRRAGAKLGFYIHAAVYAAVNLGLFAINGHFAPSYAWHVWPLAGWGMGLAFHWLAVFLLGSGSRLRESMIERELRLFDADRR